GLVLVFFSEGRTFADEDLELARNLAGAARGALERAELFEAERSARALSQQLARTGGLLATELDPAAVLDEVVQQAPRLVGVVAVYGERPRAWRPEEVEALRALAGNTSAALSNAELYQRVALEKERSFAILANIADGIVAVDREGDVVLWNRAAEQITGVPQEEALGHPPAEVLGRELESGGETPSGDRLVPIVRSGQEAWLSVTEAVMRDPAGLVAGRIFAFRDISADRAVE